MCSEQGRRDLDATHDESATNFSLGSWLRENGVENVGRGKESGWRPLRGRVLRCAWLRSAAPLRGYSSPGEVVGQDGQRHLGCNLRHRARQEVCRTHARLERAEGMLDGLTPPPHGGRIGAGSVSGLHARARRIGCHLLRGRELPDGRGLAGAGGSGGLPHRPADRRLGEKLTYRYSNVENGQPLRRYWTNACGSCVLKAACTTGNLVALDIADAFKGAGAQVIISRILQDALHQAATANLSAAVIDHALHDGVTTSDVCAQLKERDIPFIVYSGFSSWKALVLKAN